MAGVAKNKDVLLKELKEKYGNKLSPNFDNYKNNRSRIQIICKDCQNEHLIVVRDVLRFGCKFCNKENKRLEEAKKFLITAKKLHRNEYDYSEINYVNSQTKVKIKHKICGHTFIQTPANHNHKNSQGCPECANKNMDTKRFVEKAKKIKNNINDYNYDEVVYINSHTKVKIFCNKHNGYFWQRASNHLAKQYGCLHCENNSRTNTVEEFIKKSNVAHNNKYNYDKVKYKNSYTKVEVICEKHGSFFVQPQSHTLGVGCAKCNSSKGEAVIRDYLTVNNLKFEEQKRFKECMNKKTLPFDFYLPDFNLLIEFDGMQHFNIVEAWGGKDGLKTRQMKDEIKNNFAKKNGYTLIRIPHNDIDNIKNYLQFLSNCAII